ncbi:hypothetical protein M758_UG148400 [Ceratodon purpureus]|nr:hypothetical protein M758_UG148400 [Ceratodon purpureus]
MTGLVRHIFHLYDGLVGNAFEERDGEELQPDINSVPGRDKEGQQGCVRAPRVGIDRENLAFLAGDDVEGDQMEDDNLPAMETLRPTQQQIFEESARTPLYAGSSLTQLEGTLFLLNCLRTHGASNALVNEIFAILSKSMLPSVNSLPQNEYQASKVLNQLGLAYDTIVAQVLLHVCCLEEMSIRTLQAVPSVGRKDTSK